MITLAGVRRAWNGKALLEIPSLRIARGVNTALVGHNGAGKTTLLRLLAGLDQPTSGRIEREVPLASTVLCLQKPYLFKGTVAANIVYGPRLRGCTRAEGRRIAEDQARRLGIVPLLNRDSRRLSFGEAQKVALARALACKPTLLLLDEPTAGLDHDSVLALEAEVRRFVEGGGTCVVATHSPEQARRLGATIVALENGSLAPAQHHSAA